MRTPYAPATVRNVLCVFPRYTPSFGTFHHSYALLAGVRAFMPPQGLLVIASYLPASWKVRLVDENSRRATAADFRWADAVFVSGMHVQRTHIDDIVRRAHAAGCPVVLGGPSVSGCPELYPTVDILHVGEIGDATDRVIEHLDRQPGRPPRQLVFTTATRLPLDEFPIPAYDLIALREYFLASVQFSSGCPYTCEFCDIPALYGRNPRRKRPAQVLAELDRLRAGGARAVYFVDDNFIANPKAALELLPHLADWQVRNHHPLRLSCEATINIAANERLLALMRDAGFVTIFCGIETPEPAALRAMSKTQNLRVPLLDAVRRLNSYGLEVVSGIILGLDTDGPETADQILEFIDASQIPILTINILYALPKTPLWERLAREGRLVEDPARESNVEFRLPYETVLEMWRRCIRTAYAPAAVYARYAYQQRHTIPRRKAVPLDWRRLRPANLRIGARILLRLFWRLGVRGDYRRVFWRMAGRLLAAGRVEDLIQSTVVCHHLIEFTRDCLRGAPEPAFYAPRRGPAEGSLAAVGSAEAAGRP
jgi:hopanoid C-2 methylase